MSYEAISVKKIVSMIGNNEVYLPAIQRKFVWSHEQIERLFDSIMLGYPIGTFLFWNVERKKASDYTFYQFIRNYHERDCYLNEKAATPETKERIIGVLDGQQRLGSLYLALQGSYSYKKPRARWDNDEAFPMRNLCFNILKKGKQENDDTTYEFRFLTIDEQKERDINYFWVPVKTALEWEEANDYIDFATEQGLISNKTAISNLTRLWQRITQDSIVNYFEVKNDDLDDILDIFIRVNSGGTVLSKTDLLFSTIVATWEDARSEIEGLLKTLNNKGDGFSFDNDFIMRACLVLTDCPVLFNVKNFKSSNIEKIQNEWGSIKTALLNTVYLLNEFGFNKENLISRNAVLPISYHIFKGGNVNESNKGEIRKYLISSLLKQVFGGKGDRVLESIRNIMRQKQENNEYNLKFKDFSFDLIKKCKLPGDKSFNFDEEDLEHIFEHKKGAYTFMILSLLYPQLKLSQVKFHQDHIHPYSIFNKRTFKKLNISPDKQVDWLTLRDTLPNLQLLEGSFNQSKSNTPFDIWINNSIDKNNQKNYINTHYIPECDWNLTDFEQFYKLRKLLMKEAFRKIMV